MRRANTTFVDLRSTLDKSIRSSRPRSRWRSACSPSSRRLGPSPPTPSRPCATSASRSASAARERPDQPAALARRSPTSRRSRSSAATPGGHAVDVGETRGAFQETVDALRGGAKEIGFAVRTPPTSSAGSTTSRRPAAASTPSAPPRAASSRCRPSCTRTPRDQAVPALPGRRRGPGQGRLERALRGRARGLDCDESDRGTPQ